METSTAAACLVLSATASLRARHASALFYACLAACLRLEMLLFVLVSAGGWFVSESQHTTPRASKRESLGRVMAACSPLLGCLLFDLVSYHSVLPQAARAKSLVYDLPITEAAPLAFSVSFEHYALPLSLLQAAQFLLWARWRARSRVAAARRAHAPGRGAALCMDAESLGHVPVVRGQLQRLHQYHRPGQHDA